MVLDEKDARASRIVFQDRKSEDQKLPAQGTSIPGVVVGDNEHEGGPISECL